MKIDICALFPDILNSYLGQRLIEQAIAEQLLTINTHCFRDFDSAEMGPVAAGPCGKLLRAEPVIRCATHLQQHRPDPGNLVMLTPHGRPFNQDVAQELAGHDRLILLCGRFGGFEQSVHSQLPADEISVGDYVLNGGEVAALVLIDAIIRLVPGVLDRANRGQSSRESPVTGSRRMLPMGSLGVS